jgi:protein SCO1/2
VKKAVRKAVTWLAAAALLGGGVFPAGAQTPQQVIEEVRFEQRINAQLPLELKFRDETGREVALGEYFGKRPVVLALVYYECPMLCTLVLNGLIKTLRAVKYTPGKEFDIVVVSFDPGETPQLAAEKKASYVRELGRPETAGGWHFLTGEEENIRKLTETVGFQYIYDAKTDQYAHASGIMVATPQGKLYRYFYGIEYAPRDLRFALIEASQNKVGTLADQVMLFCYHYDPTTGKYGVLINRVMQLLGTATVVLLAGFILVSLWRERRKTALAGAGHGAAKV